ncbi:hypothetical protein RJT34_03037 [Clitoria ternatea]|uniref:Uncharacterized protein n=1 Tax=Clitoria ternatea TaxID=43366 RepID=A0AAN9KLD6_CLITE
MVEADKLYVEVERLRAASFNDKVEVKRIKENLKIEREIRGKHLVEISDLTVKMQKMKKENSKLKKENSKLKGETQKEREKWIRGRIKVLKSWRSFM